MGGRAAYIQRKRDVIAALKSVPCADCGKTYPPYVMDFDHRDPTEKSFTIAGAMLRLGIDSILEEIEKCDVVCSNCHRERTHGRKQPI